MPLFTNFCPVYRRPPSPNPPKISITLESIDSSLSSNYLNPVPIDINFIYGNLDF